MKYIILLLQLLTCFLFIAQANAQVLNCNCSDISLREVTAKSGLILRQLPSINSEKVTGIPFGEKVMVGFDADLVKADVIENKQGYWVRANYRGAEGFLFNGFLSEQPVYDVLPNIEIHLPNLEDGPFMGLFVDEEEPYGQGLAELKKINYDTINYESHNGLIDYSDVVIAETKYPYFTFFGLNNAERKVNAWLFETEEGNLYPGVMRTVYYSGSNYTLYATGEVVRVENDDSGNGELMMVKNYEVILERRSPDAVQRQVIMKRKSMPMAYWGSGGLANIRMAGDLDGDAQPDFIIENYLMEGYESSLFLSSEAEDGFLVKLVRMVIGSCC